MGDTTGRASALLTRREAIVSLATLATGSLIQPASIFASSARDSKTRIAVLGDFGTGEDDEFAVAAQMLNAHRSSPLDLVLTVGDNIYPNGSGRYFTKHFEVPFEGLLNERVKFYATLGNHDVEEGRKDQLQYPLFNMGGSNYYSISRGNGLVDIFVLDTSAYDARQAIWLENSLRASRATWKIASMHHAIYSSAKKHGSDPKLAATLEPLLTRYHVQVVFAGHDHVYERTKPQRGIQHFITGAGGKMRRGDIDMKSPFRAASYDRDNSFMVIEIDESEMAFRSISESGEVVDSGVIRQSSAIGVSVQAA